MASVPSVSSPDEAAEVIVIRRKSAVESPLSYIVMLDGQEIFRMKAGDYASFKVEPGTHSIGVEWLYSWPSKWREMTLIVACDPRTKYYFLVRPRGTMTIIEPISEQRGLELVSKSTYKPMTQ